MIGYVATGLEEAADVLNPGVPLTTLDVSPLTNPDPIGQRRDRLPISMLCGSAVTVRCALLTSWM